MKLIVLLRCHDKFYRKIKVELSKSPEDQLIDVF